MTLSSGHNIPHCYQSSSHVCTLFTTHPINRTEIPRAFLGNQSSSSISNVCTYIHVYLDLYILFPCTDLINYNAAEFAECLNFIGLIAFMGSNKISNCTHGECRKAMRKNICLCTPSQQPLYKAALRQLRLEMHIFNSVSTYVGSLPHPSLVGSRLRQVFAGIIPESSKQNRNQIVVASSPISPSPHFCRTQRDRLERAVQS